MSENAAANLSSAGMDRKIEKKSWTAGRTALIAGGVFVAALLLYTLLFADLRSALNVDRDKVTISTVTQGNFQNFIQVNGTVQPIQTIYLDALEGGVVEEVYIETGTMVEKGDTILTLSNSDLQLNVMQRTSAIYDQINQTRNSRLNIEQNTLSLKQQLASAENQLEIQRAEYSRIKKLHDKDEGMVSEQDFLEARENFRYQQKRHDLLFASYRQDSIQATRQLDQIDESLDRMYQSLNAVQRILDRLVVTAPISGQLSTMELNPGQSISRGERIGQVDILDQFKVRVGVDEYYLARISSGLEGSFDFAGDSYSLEITKVYPVVEDGQFQVDMEFTGDTPSGLTRGQTLRIRLQMGESNQAVLLSRGGFYQSTGGNWIYKVTDEGSRAVRQEIRLGGQNPNYYEVLAGLEPGDRVITSSYDTFGDNEVLNLE